MNDFSNEVCAVILTGGKSSRMGGGIKSLKKFNNKLIFDRIFENLQNQVQKIIINSNDLENLFINYNVEIIKDSIKGFLGPLAGIHAALEWLTENEPHIKWLISVPGDTPFIPNDLVKQLLDKAKKDKHQIVLAQSNKKTHPIIGLWHLSLYQSLKNDLNSGVRKILDWASKHQLGYVEFSNFKYDPFFNINFKEDIIKAQEIENNYLKK